MADIAKLVYGATSSTWTSAGFTASDFNSRANGSVVVATTTLDNDSGMDLEAEVSFSFEVGGTTTAASRFDLYILPLNRDGTTLGDGVADAWNGAAEWHRDSAFLAHLAAGLGLSIAQVDDLFRAADAIRS
jgi:hypothetical protein